jgi:HEAT repeat protein
MVTEKILEFGGGIMAKDAKSKMDNLISDLASDDDSTRKNARLSLVAMGRRAIPFLVEVLKDRHDLPRSEATKALSEISDPEAAPALVKMLEDEEFGIRWAAAIGLVGMNTKGLRPLFKALEEKPGSDLLREGAHHVIHDLAKGELRKFLVPLLVALGGPAPTTQTLVAAYRAMEDLERAKII